MYRLISPSCFLITFPRVSLLSLFSASYCVLLVVSSLSLLTDPSDATLYYRKMFINSSYSINFTSVSPFYIRSTMAFMNFDGISSLWVFFVSLLCKDSAGRRQHNLVCQNSSPILTDKGYITKLLCCFHSTQYITYIILKMLHLDFNRYALNLKPWKPNCSGS